MRKIILISAFSILTAAAGAQQTFDYNFNAVWQEKPVIHNVPATFDSSGAAVILDETVIEYKTEGKELYQFNTYHQVVKLLTDKGIEAYNKIYIPLYRSGELTELKARTLTPSGKVIDVPDSKIKETEEDGVKYKLFAFEGTEAGCEVEYTYTNKTNIRLFGTENFQRRNYPTLLAKFYLVTPQYLKFDAKGYNGFSVSNDTVIDEKRIIEGLSENIRELDDEKYAYRDKYLQRVDYKLSYNISKDASVRLYTWKEYAKKAYSVYTYRTSKDEKALDAFIKQMEINTGDKAEKIVSAAEEYIKMNIDIDNDNEIPDNVEDNIAFTIKNKSANTTSAIQLFSAVFDRLGIKYQFVIAGDRSGLPMDEEIEDWNRTDNVLFYFPETQKLIDPMATALRYPFIPADYCGINGLFLKSTTIGDFTTATASFKEVPMEPFDAHAVNMEADVSFDESHDTLIIHSRQILKGYGAISYRPIYTYLTKDKQDEANKEIIKAVGGNSENISNIKIENSKLTDYCDNKPLIIGGDIKSTELLEKAGNKILFKLGEIIGPQEEMYQEKPRQTPVELPFPHVLDRVITLHIPDGYTVKNPGDININVTHTEGGETTMGFVSSYTQNGNVITITVNEYYKQINYPLSQFEDFKNVINASADFNKIVLVLEKN